MNPETTPLPPDETHELPFEFFNAYWETTTSGRFLFATWRNQLCWTTSLDCEEPTDGSFKEGGVDSQGDKVDGSERGKRRGERTTM